MAIGTKVRRFTLDGRIMGGSYRAAFHAPSGLSLPEVSAAIAAAVARVDRQMSNWRADSDLNRLNQAPPGTWTDLPEPLMAVLQTGLDIGTASNGAFDIAVGDLVGAWGFGPPHRQPDPAAIRSLTGRPRGLATDALELDRPAGRARRLAPVAIDLSAIAKGFGVDEMARCLDQFDIASYLVGIDGELRARGRKSDGNRWAVGIETPDRRRAEPLGVIEIADAAIATSGDYRNQIAVGDVRLSHLMDPTAARPVQNDVASVSVLAESCMTADAWATALLVLGPEAGSELARSRQMDALFVLRHGAGRAGRPAGPGFRQLAVGLFREPPTTPEKEPSHAYA